MRAVGAVEGAVWFIRINLLIFLGLDLFAARYPPSPVHKLAKESMLKFVESVVLFVPDIDAAAVWYAEIFGAEVRYENERYAFIRVPSTHIGFHPADAKCPGGIGGTTVYWQVDDLGAAIDFLQRRGAKLHRGPAVTSFGAGAAMLIDPFGCTIGLNAPTAQSLVALGELPAASPLL